MCPITINTCDQLTSEGKALFKELELDKNPAVTLNVCDLHIPSDESADDKIVSIDNLASLIVLLEGEENTGKENLTVTTLKFVAAHMAVRLNWETFVSAANFAQQRFIQSDLY